MFVLVFVLLNLSRVVTSTIEETLSETYFAITANFAERMTDLGSKLPANHCFLTWGFSSLDKSLLSGHHLELGRRAMGKDNLLGRFLLSGEV